MSNKKSTISASEYEKLLRVESNSFKEVTR